MSLAASPQHVLIYKDATHDIKYQSPIPCLQVEGSPKLRPSTQSGNVQAMAISNTMSGGLSDSQPDDSKENFQLQRPISPPSRETYDEFDTMGSPRTSPESASPSRRPAEPFSPCSQETPRTKRLRLRAPNPATHLRRARREAIARNIPGIYHPEEYDPDHDPWKEDEESLKERRAENIRLVSSDEKSEEEVKPLSSEGQSALQSPRQRRRAKLKMRQDRYKQVFDIQQ